MTISPPLAADFLFPEQTLVKLASTAYNAAVELAVGGGSASRHTNATPAANEAHPSSSKARDKIWSDQMRAAIAGDEQSYRKLLTALAPVIRSASRSGFARFGAPANDVEDVLQETLLAIHLKRHTWKQTEALTPWVLAIARNKLIDHLRRGGKAIKVPIDDVIETLETETAVRRFDDEELAVMLDALPERQREIVRMTTLEGMAYKDVASRLEMNEGAVRVGLHRSLKAMAKIYRSQLA